MKALSVKGAVRSAILLFCVSVFSITVSASSNGAKRPNFVWLIAEDSSRHYFGLYDEQGAKTPTLNALAQHGFVYNHAFSNAPVCSTARSVLATGAYNPRIGTQHHRSWVATTLPADLTPVSKLLMNAGYYATNNAKTDYNFAGTETFWDQTSPSASWRNRKAEQAFFHVQTWHGSHEHTLHFPVSDVNNVPTKHDPSVIKLPPIYPDTSTFRYTYARYLDRVQMVDAEMGDVVNQLKEDGLLEDTFIFAFGDHGGVLPGSKGYVFETGLHIPLVVRVPENFRHLLHKDMRELKNTRLDGFVSFVDFAPTLLKLAGIKKSKEHDGDAFLGRDVSLKKANKKQSSFSYADRFDEKIDLVRAIRIGKYKYIRSFEPFNPNGLYNNYRYKQAAFKEWESLYRSGELNAAQASFYKMKPAEALYDVESDPFETINLAEREHLGPVLNDMRKALFKKMRALPDFGLFPESYQVSNALDQPKEFAKKNKRNISGLLDIANLQLQSYDRVKSDLKAYLSSEGVWERYWALIVLSSFSGQAADMVPAVNALLATEKNQLVRARAHQFLALSVGTNPVKGIEGSIRNAAQGIQALEIMNIATQLKEFAGYSFTVEMRADWAEPQKGDPEFVQKKNRNYVLNNRVSYLKP